jgi:hypothetical protein
MQKFCINDGEFTSLGGISKKGLFNLELKDLLEDECEQIVMSSELFNAFKANSKRKKYYRSEKIYNLFKYVVYLYNDTLLETENFGALTYLERISSLLDYIDTYSIIELSIDQLNLLLDLDDGDAIKEAYNSIQKKRYELTKKEFGLFTDMLKNVKSKINMKDAKKAYDYISLIYNSNTILQDNISYMDYLEAFSKISINSILTMRMYQIIEMFKIQINYENVNEEKKLLNDLTEKDFGLNTL